MRELDLSHNKLYRLQNKTHGLFDDCLSIRKVPFLNHLYHTNLIQFNY